MFYNNNIQESKKKAKKKSHSLCLYTDTHGRWWVLHNHSVFAILRKIVDAPISSISNFIHKYFTIRDFGPERCFIAVAYVMISFNKVEKSKTADIPRVLLKLPELSTSIQFSTDKRTRDIENCWQPRNAFHSFSYCPKFQRTQSAPNLDLWECWRLSQFAGNQDWWPCF